MSADLWHKKPAPGAAPCKSCRGIKGAPTKVHGQKGRYAARWDVLINGKRKQMSERFETRAEADEFEAEMRRDVRRGTYRDRDRGEITLSYWAEQWLKLTAPDRAETTAESLEYSVRRSVLPHLGDMRLSDLQFEPAIIRNWANGLKAAGSRDGSIQTAYGHLSAILDYAVESNRMAANPCRQKSAKPKGLDPQPRKAGWTAEKVAAVHLAQPGKPHAGWRPREGSSVWDRYRAAVLTAAACGGMRLAEVIGLAKDDVLFLQQGISIETTLVRARGLRYFSQTKTQAGTRVAAMPGCVAYALAAHIERYPPVAITLPLYSDKVRGKAPAEWPLVTRELLFTARGGAPMVGPGFQSALRYVLAYTGLIEELPDKAGAAGMWRRYQRPSDVGLHFHALRNFYISTLLAAGLPLVDVKEQVGHKRAASLGVAELGHHRDVTLDTYARPMAGSAKRVRDVMDETFGPLLTHISLTSARETQ